MFFGRLCFEGRVDIEERPLFGALTSLGRALDNDVRLEDPTVSRYHARIQCDESGCRIMDLGSGNGTRVDGVELEVKVDHPLADRSLVQIGPFSIRYLAPVAQREPSSGARPAVDTGEERQAEAKPLGQTVVVSLPMPPRLVVTTPRGTSEHPLTGATLTLGRDPANDIVVDFDAISRRHARLDRRDSCWEITDLGSTNGLRLQDEKVEHAPLTNGDVVYVGQSVTMEFRDPQASAAVAQRGAGVERRSASFDLPAKGPLILGRSENADVTVFHPQVQRAHAQIVQRAGGTYLEDLGSSAGTYVNGQLIKEHLLAEGDVVRIGSSRLVLEQGRLRLVDEAGDLRLDAFHLSRVVGKGLAILQDVSLSIYPQEFVAIVGGSGAGKSTLLNAISGYRPANSGTVLLNGVDLYRNFNAYRNDLGYVPQDDLIHRELPVRRSLDYAAQMRMPADTSAAERRQRIEEVIDELDLRVAADRAVRSLSGGQRKRVSIGVELLTRPSLFFLDEATSGLDPGTETQMMKLLRRLADQGRTVALVTHATKNVMVCDKVIFMARGGRLAYYGPPEDALRYFQVDDFDEIYSRMEKTEPTESEVRYRRSPQFQEHVVKRLTEAQSLATTGSAGDPLSLPSAAYPAAAAAPGARGPAGARPGTAPSAPRQMSSWRQFVVLTKRYIDTIWSDKKSAALLLAIAPFLGVLDFIQWKRHTFDLVTGSASQAVTMFFMTTILCLLVGCITSVREIVKEDAIYRRERMVGLRVVPYVGSKVAVGLGLAVYSAITYFSFKLLAVDFSFLSVVDILKLLVPIIIAMFAGVMWGLLISAVAPSEDRAMLLMIVAIVPQFVFSGGMIPMSDLGTAGKIVGAAMSTRWALGALVTSAQVESGPRLEADLSDTYMPGSEGFASLPEKQAMINSLHDQYGAIFHVNVGFYWGMAAVICLVLLVLVVMLQKRKDTL